MLVVEFCVFDNNMVGDAGGAIYLTYQIGTLVNNSFTNNQASTGGAIYYEEDCILIYFIKNHHFFLYNNSKLCNKINNYFHE
jgi:predicted outer membrane repeat protein